MMDETPHRPDVSVSLPAPLRARPEADPLVERAERALRELRPHARSVDPRFLAGLEHLAGALRGLAGMRAEGFGGEATETAGTALEAVLQRSEAALGAAQAELDQARRRARTRSSRPRQAAAASA